MKYTPRQENSRDMEAVLYFTLEPIAKGLGLVILELSLFRRKGKGASPGSAHIRVTVYKDGNIGVDDCSRFHRAVLPRLELTFPGSEVYLEVSSPGIGRLIKDGFELVHFVGQGLRCYSLESSGWIAGILEAVDEKGIVLETEEGKIVLSYEAIAKAKLDENMKKL